MNATLHHRSTRRAPVARERKHQRGIVLLEALVALLIFSVGVLGLIGLQATSVKQASAAEYRSTAVLQANDLISRMWVSDRSDAILKAQFAATGDGYKAWKDAWVAALPGAAANPPEVVIKSEDKGATASLGTNTVTVTIYWKAPSDDDTRKYVLVAQLDQPQK